MPTSLPAAPSLEQLRKQAKELLRAHRSGDPDAVARVAAQHPHPDEPLKLTGAQLVVAREHGFPSWPRLRAYVERLAAYGPGLQHAYHEDLDYYEGRAYGLRASAQDGTPSATAAFERWGAPVTEAGSRTAIARTAASLTGSPATTRRRSSTRRCAGRRATTASRCSSRSSSAARAWSPTSTAAPRSCGPPRRARRRRSGRSSRSAPIPTAARPSAARRTATASRRCTSPRRAATSSRSRRSSTPPADPTLRDGLYSSTPAGWAEFGRQHAAAELLRDRES